MGSQRCALAVILPEMAPSAHRKLPIGIQDFPALRQEGFLYVDKTALVHRLANDGRVYFLARPRRFGKSLLLSTLATYFEGRRDLFQGLAIDRLEASWSAHPVLHLDLNAEKYDNAAGLRAILNRHLERWELQFPGGNASRSPAERFLAVIERAHTQTGKRVVVLVDEYDKPLLSALSNPKLAQEYKLELKAFYGVLKSADVCLRFAMLTGVTKFGQASIFSDLNQLIDLSLHADYASVCGITEDELVLNFAPELEELAHRHNLAESVCLAEVRRMYDGYRFHPNGPSAYNPFSTLSLFGQYEFLDFWFQTGTPTFLVELLKNTDRRAPRTIGRLLWASQASVALFAGGTARVGGDDQHDRRGSIAEDVSKEGALANLASPGNNDDRKYRRETLRRPVIILALYTLTI